MSKSQRSHSRRGEEILFDTAWGHPVRPHSSPNTMRKEDCDPGLSSETAWQDPMQPLSSQQRNTRQSTSRNLGDPANLKTLKPAPTARPDPRQD